MKASFLKYTLQFKQPGGTSRGVLTQKDTYFIILEDQDRMGIGEAGLFRGLSSDDVPEYETQLERACRALESPEPEPWVAFRAYPSIVFAMEQALRSIDGADPFILFEEAPFSKGEPLPINGLIWMGDLSYMKQQVAAKLKDGFTCLKFKIGAIDFQDELGMLREIRREFSAGDLEIRVDANGAFGPEIALERLKQLSDFQLHSIEQPIGAGQPHQMAELCARTPLPIALDEELIGCIKAASKSVLLQTIRPQYIILKPSLVGGFSGSEEWIRQAEAQGSGWWVTSALESNIGLNAIAQWTSTLGVDMPQGLGTGSLFTNNFESPLEVQKGRLRYRLGKAWDIQKIHKVCT
ncbi:MAG: o-succinylbenzoate synthase [Robiginitalea sp.]|uniref:o-succinylbenzoate synthase n=1 Tax=Robiginitalea sp. TaxID=1902411 RepID=UPI003C713E90